MVVIGSGIGRNPGGPVSFPTSQTVIPAGPESHTPQVPGNGILPSAKHGIDSFDVGIICHNQYRMYSLYRYNVAILGRYPHLDRTEHLV